MPLSPSFFRIPIDEHPLLEMPPHYEEKRKKIENSKDEITASLIVIPKVDLVEIAPAFLF